MGRECCLLGVRVGRRITLVSKSLPTFSHMVNPGTGFSGPDPLVMQLGRLPRVNADGPGPDLLFPFIVVFYIEGPVSVSEKPAAAMVLCCTDSILVV